MEETTVNRKSPIIIGIAGGTGSGKSTFTNRLKDAFGDQVTVLYTTTTTAPTMTCHLNSAKS